MTVSFVRGVRTRLKNKHDVSVGTTERVLERIQKAVPHLSFKEWSHSLDAIESGAVAVNQKRRELRVSVKIGTFALCSCCARTLPKVVSLEDQHFLHNLAREAEKTLEHSDGIDISLADFGSTAVADTLKEELHLAQSPLPILQFLRGVSQQTYESQRISYGVILSADANASMKAPLAAAGDNKRFKRLSDGYSTAFLLDGEGHIVGLEPLPLAEPKGEAPRRRPNWLGNLAETAGRYKGAGIGLTRNGDILISLNRKLAFSQRGGLWKRWNHSAIIETLRSGFKFRGKPYDFVSVLTFVYQVALDLSFRRSGGLFVILQSRECANKLLSSKEQIGSEKKRAEDQALDSGLSGRRLHKWERQLAADIASLDGATVIDRNGNVISYGQVLRVGGLGKGEQGARTRAATEASKCGLSIKVSSDGDISMYAKGKKLFEI